MTIVGCANEPVEIPCNRSCAVSLENLALAIYSCPNCRAELEADVNAWDGWLRCPACGRASLPPEPIGLPRDDQSPAAASTTNGVPEITFAPVADGAVEFPKVAAGRMAHTSLPRLIFTTGLVLCLLLTLVSFIDVKPMRLGIFGFLSMVFFMLLLRTPRKRAYPGKSWGSAGNTEADTAGRNEG